MDKTHVLHGVGLLRWFGDVHPELLGCAMECIGTGLYSEHCRMETDSLGRVDIFRVIVKEKKVAWWKRDLSQNGAKVISIRFHKPHTARVELSVEQVGVAKRLRHMTCSIRPLICRKVTPYASPAQLLNGVGCLCFHFDHRPYIEGIVQGSAALPAGQYLR